ncbi:CAP domain-containing protein, partial [Tricharina praecox]|uniref:CAP domain-containing protein n=1 Tax=Tricharina praecox TaxID=43433 RepID=UPI00221FF458
FVLFYILAALALLGIAGARNSTNDFRNECVSAHNKYREIHGAGALEWNDQLAAKADELARECPDMVVPTGYEKAAHSASVSIGYDNVTAAINSIYAARKHYNFATGHWNRKIGHFTLVVWRGSRYLGCAVKLC